MPNGTAGRSSARRRSEQAKPSHRRVPVSTPGVCPGLRWDDEFIRATDGSGPPAPRWVENDLNKNNEVRPIINLPPRHLKSLMASTAFPAWCLGHDPSAQILCVSYAQDLADKLARDCRAIMRSPWYRRIFSTRLAPHRQAVQEFITTCQATGSPPRPAAC